MLNFLCTMCTIWCGEGRKKDKNVKVFQSHSSFSLSVEVNQTNQKEICSCSSGKANWTYRNISGDKSAMLFLSLISFCFRCSECVCAPVYCFICLFLCLCTCNMRLCRCLNKCPARACVCVCLHARLHVCLFFNLSSFSVYTPSCTCFSCKSLLAMKFVSSRGVNLICI